MQGHAAMLVNQIIHAEASEGACNCTDSEGGKCKKEQFLDWAKVNGHMGTSKQRPLCMECVAKTGDAHF